MSQDTLWRVKVLAVVLGLGLAAFLGIFAMGYQSGVLL